MTDRKITWGQLGAVLLLALLPLGTELLPGRLAQVGAAAVLSLPEHRGKIGFLGAVKNARFRRQVTPGDVLTLTCTILREKAGVAQAEAVAEVDGQPAVTAELTFALRRDG